MNVVLELIGKILAVILLVGTLVFVGVPVSLVSWARDYSEETSVVHSIFLLEQDTGPDVMLEESCKPSPDVKRDRNLPLRI